MRAEYSFWSAIFVLTFLDEYYAHTLVQNIEKTVYYDKTYYENLDRNLDKKFEQIKDDDLQDFINLQIDKHEKGLYVRELDEWELEGYKNPIEYFKSDTVQEFLTKINNKTFVKIIERILDNKQNNLIGTPDYIIWNSKDMIFVEVKRKSEKLSEAQIAWGEFLVKNKILYRVVRVIGR